MKQSLIKINCIVFTVFAILGTNYTASAHNKVVVIPMSGEDLAPLQNVVSVAKSGGDFDDLNTAMESISDASADNPYLILIAPGVYSLSKPVLGKDYIDIAGSGRALTRLVGSHSGTDFDQSSALLVMAPGTHLQSLSIENAAQNNPLTFAVYTNGSARLTDVQIKASGASFVSGMLNFISDVTLNNVTVETTNSPFGFGIVNSLSHIVARDTHITAIASTASTGVRNSSSSSHFSDSSIRVISQGTEQIGINNLSDASSARLVNTIISASSDRVGAAPMSLVAAGGFGVNETHISSSFLEGGVSGSPICNFSFLINGNPLAQNCQPDS